MAKTTTAIAGGMLIWLAMAGSAAAEAPWSRARDTLSLHEMPGPSREKALPSLLGRPLFVTAYGRRMAADTPFHRAEMREAVAMGKVTPGYPQPALFTMRFRLAM